MVLERSKMHQQTRLADRRGQAVIEFAIVAFVLTFLLGSMLALGFLFFSANVLQQAADVGAMEFARHPFAPDGKFRDGLSDSNLFDEKFLVCEIGGEGVEDLPENYSREDYRELQQRMPLINRLLFPIYVYDPDINQPNGVLRYPGTVVTRNGELTVVIPIVGSRAKASGVETISEWRRVVEEIVPDGEANGPYSVTASEEEYGNLGTGGWVALRINYPYQSAGLVAYLQKDSDDNVLGPTESLGRDDITNLAVLADDSAVTGDAAATFPNGETLLAAGFTLVAPTPNPDFGASAHRGEFSLGELQAHATAVRPYRKVISLQAIYRREVFSDPLLP